MEISLSQFVDFAVTISDWHKINNSHDERVMTLCLAMADQLENQFDSERVVMLKHAARLHDIGRVGIRHDVMTFPGKWIDSDRAAGREHVMIGYNLVRDMLGETEIPLAIKHHHENWNGTGYPDALKGENIPLFARMIRIADEWDALRNKRPYRAALTFENALHIMNLDAIYFDPQLYAVFLKIIKQGIW